MTSQFKKAEVLVPFVTLVVLALVWAINGYDDTWLYVSAAVIAVPTSWFYLGKRG